MIRAGGFPMRLRLFGIALGLVFVSHIAAAQTPTPTPPPYGSDLRPLFVPPQSVADPQGADAVVFNPSGLAFEPAGDIVYVHSDRVNPNGLGDGDALYFKSSRYLNLGAEWARPAKDVSQTL